MKKLFILFSLLASFSLHAQNVPDLIRTTPVPSTGANKNNRATVDANLKASLAFLPPVGDAYTLNGAKDSVGYLFYNRILKRLGIYRGANVWDNPLNVVTTSYQNLNVNQFVQPITDVTSNFGKSLYLPQGSTDPGVRPIYGPYLGLENGEYTYKFYLRINSNLTDTARFLHVDIAENGVSITSTYIRYSDFIGENIWTPFRIVFNGVKGRNYECRIDVVHGSDPYPAQYPTKTNLWYDYGQIIGIREFVPTDLGIYATHTELTNGLNSLTSSNGLTKIGNDTQLGGILTHYTSISADENQLDFHGQNSRYTWVLQGLAGSGEDGPEPSSIKFGTYDTQTTHGSALNLYPDAFELRTSRPGVGDFAISSNGSITDDITSKGLSYSSNYFNAPITSQDYRRIPDIGAVMGIVAGGVTGYATDSTVVHKTGQETIQNEKTATDRWTFLKGVRFKADNSAYIDSGTVSLNRLFYNNSTGLQLRSGQRLIFNDPTNSMNWQMQWSNEVTGGNGLLIGKTGQPYFQFLDGGTLIRSGNSYVRDTVLFRSDIKGKVDSTTIANTYVTKGTQQNITALKTLGSKSHETTFTIYGTSLATKFGYNGTWRYSDAYPYKLTKALNFQLSLKGGTGNTTLTYTNAIAATPIPAYTAGDMIGFEVGVNDASNADATTYSTANYTTRVNGLINSAIAAGYPANRIWIFSAFYWTLGDPTRANDIVNATASIASSRGVLYFDGYNTYKSRVNDGTFTLAGGLHPTIAAQTIVAADMQTYLNAYAINSSVEFLNVYDATTTNTLNNVGTANFTGNTIINNLQLNTSRVSTGNQTGDIYVRDADGYTTPIPDVATGQVLASGGVGAPPAYTNAPTVTRLTSNQDIFISGARTGGGYSMQINQVFTPTANNQLLSGGLIFPTYSTGTGALTATFSGTTTATDGTYTAQATVNGTAAPTTNATYTVVVSGGVVTSATPVVNGVGYNIGDTFTIAAIPGVTFTVASLGYTGVSRAAMTFSGAPITLSTISTPPNPIVGQLWNNTTGVLKFFSTATRRVVLMDDGNAATTQMLVGNGTDWTRTTVTGTAGTAPVLAGSPVFSGTPTAPTATPGTSTTQLATMAAVTPANVRTNAATLTLPTTNLTNYYTFFGTSSTWTLPTIASSSNYTYYVKNAGSANLTINSNAGGTDIYYTSAVSNIVLTPGQAVIIHNDSVAFQIE